MKSAKISDSEQERVWKNTERFRTADSEVATIYELLRGLHRSGYPNWGCYFCEGPQYTIIQKESLPAALDEIIIEMPVKNGVPFLMSLADFGDYSAYENGKLGYYPSVLLTSNDIHANPESLSLIIGELMDCVVYYDGYVTIDRKNREIIPFYKKQTSKNIFNLNKKEASEWSEELARKMCSRIEKMKNSEGYHSYGRRSTIDMDFREGNIHISGIPLFEAGTIGYSELRIRDLNKRLKVAPNEKARIRIENAISGHLGNLKEGGGDYFPCYIIKTA